jgi:hypothetical protein
MTYNTKEKFMTNTWFDGDVIRWISNNSVPPKDVVEQFFENGLITAEQKEYADNTRAIELTEFLKKYKEAQANRSEEQKAMERAEVRAAFGKDVTVQNIFTGEVI